MRTSSSRWSVAENHGGADRAVEPVVVTRVAILSAATAHRGLILAHAVAGHGPERRLRERVTWQKELAAHFDKSKRYPEDREVRSAEVIVDFVSSVTLMFPWQVTGEPAMWDLTMPR